MLCSGCYAPHHFSWLPNTESQCVAAHIHYYKRHVARVGYRNSVHWFSYSPCISVALLSTKLQAFVRLGKTNKGENGCGNKLRHS